MSRAALADAVRPFAPGGSLRQEHMPAFDAFADALGLAKGVTTDDTPFTGEITARIALELIGHEAIVQEAYKDSKSIWTWGIGVTNASGHSIDRYKDAPQPVARCVEIFLWLCRTKYGPDVLAAFKGHALTEAQYAAALSFHYNTGAIGRATWVKSFLAGRHAEAENQFMEWRKPAAIIERRTKERDLFFDGRWTSDGKVTIYPVRKPSYAPDFGKGERVDVREDLAKALSPS